MEIPDNIKRRVKIHIKAKEHNFYGVFPPGFTKEALSELQKLGIEKIISVEKGGVLFTCTIEDIYRLNLRSLIFVRFLMRISSFKTTGFSKLSRKISEIPWELYLLPDTKPLIKTTCSKSRLYHSDAVSENVINSLTERMKEYYSGYSPYSENSEIYIRIADDRVTVSIDTSGEPLYMRGYKKYISKAPIRENIAAAVISNYNLSGYRRIIDPMCGSGTFIFESIIQSGLAVSNNLRKYNFQYFPVYSENTFNYIMKTSFSYYSKIDNIEFTGYDIDEKNINSADLNLSILSKTPLPVKFIKGDFFNIKNHDNKKTLILINPPYGKRVDMNNDLYAKIGQKLKEDFKGSDAAVIVPDIKSGNSLSLKPEYVRNFKNGGLPVSVLFVKL